MQGQRQHVVTRGTEYICTIIIITKVACQQEAFDLLSWYLRCTVVYVLKEHSIVAWYGIEYSGVAIFSHAQ
jgi:hypothetical protein